MARNKVIIVEGSQGAGKSTLTNWLREQIPSSTLIRLTGIEDKSENGEYKSYKYHQAILHAILNTRHVGMNYILDRSFLSEYVYCQLGYKPYEFKHQYVELSLLLNHIAQYYDVYFISLYLPNVTDYIDRLSHRQKYEYQMMCATNSWDQQLKYIDIIDGDMSSICTYVNFKHYNATSDVNELIMEFCGFNSMPVINDIEGERMVTKQCMKLDVNRVTENLMK